MSEKIQAMRKLSDWIQEYGWKVYFNQKNPDDYPVFHANTNSKPDLLLQKNNYNILVEVKSGEDHQDILNGIDQVLKYSGEYYSGRTAYSTDKKKNLKIDGIVFATSFSKNGYLYGKEGNINYLDYSNFLSKKKNMTEKPITHSITRFLWRQWEEGYAFNYFRDLRKGKAKNELVLPDNKPHIGTIIAKTKKDTRQTTLEPWLYLNSNQFIPLNYDEIYLFEG